MADGWSVYRLMSIVLLLGVVLPALMVLYAEAKRIHWPGEKASIYVRDGIQRGMETMDRAWTMTRLVLFRRQ